MPHIRAIYPASTSQEDFLIRNALWLRRILANASGYQIKEIAIIPEEIPAYAAGLRFNNLPLEFVLDLGVLVKTEDDAKSVAEQFRHNVVEYCSGAKELHFGVWARAFGINEFVEHRPPVRPTEP